jgi:hypothetical protein
MYLTLTPIKDQIMAEIISSIVKSESIENVLYIALYQLLYILQFSD